MLILHFTSLLYKFKDVFIFFDMKAIKELFTFHATRKATPVSEYEEWQFFSVEVHDCLCSFIGRIWEPHLSSLLDNLQDIYVHS